MKTENIKKIFTREYLLASKSPRRISLLNQIGIKFTTIDSGVKEFESNYHNPIDIVKYNSELKAKSVLLKNKKRIVIAADTIVYIDKTVLHKPMNAKIAAEYLRKLSGRRHTVYSGFFLVNPLTLKEIFDYEKTYVYFRNLTNYEIDYYIRNYKPLDKAGAYGIQDDYGCLFIEKIIGDYFNVVGLPLKKLYLNLFKI